MSENFVDQVARDLAAQALSAIGAHNLLCEERQKRMDDKSTVAQIQQTEILHRITGMDAATQEAFRGVFRRQIMAVVTVNFLLLSITGFLIVEIFFKH